METSELAREVELRGIDIDRIMRDPKAMKFEGVGYLAGVPGSFNGVYTLDDLTLVWKPNVIITVQTRPLVAEERTFL